MIKKPLINLIVLATLLPSCSFIPNFKRPKPPVAETWPVTTDSQQASIAADIGWREFFINEKLRKVIELALNNNRDLRVAALNIERARAQYQITTSNLFPTVNASGNATIQKSGESSSGNNNLANVINNGVIQQSNGSSGEITRNYRVGVSFSSYELDFFGRIRSLNTQALQLFLATEEARRSTHIALISEVANAWLTLQADKERLKLAQNTLQSQQSSYDLNKSRFDYGIATGLDLQQAQILVDTAKVDVARFTSLIQQDENALVLLIGSNLPVELRPDNELQAVTVLADLPAGLPSEVLLKRPDVLQAEYNLQAANANIGAARAAFYPAISLTASVGSASRELNNLFSSGTGFWNFVPQIVVPIFNAGRNRANLKIAEVDRDITVAQYEKTIQTAFREVADSLAIRQTLTEQFNSQSSLVNASSESFRLSEARYKSGIDNYLLVLDSQRTLYAAQQNLISIRLIAFSNQVTLYKVLGGGWNETTHEKIESK
ncbi:MULTISPECIES: efflux transporter outer membrane subunit [Methylotenera]|uniref:efflux transporter outer membrane subunit n=1 Tax=Methylotenera TaxID=359407 RepID=UPI000374D5E9|nr:MULTISPECIES: efflux transporter outer membrane subunit [Methylotenera]